MGFGIKMRACREGRRESGRKDDSGMLAACMEFGMKMDKVRGQESKTTRIRIRLRSNYCNGFSMGEISGRF